MMEQQKPARSPEIVTRKTVAEEQPDSPKNKLVDFLKSSAIITNSCTGVLTLSFQNGGLRSSKLELIDPI